MDTASHTIYLILLTEQKLAGQQDTPAPRKQKFINSFLCYKILNKMVHGATETARGSDPSIKSIGSKLSLMGCIEIQQAKYSIVAIRSCGNVSFMVGLVRFDWRTHYLRKMQDIQLGKRKRFEAR